MLTRTDQCSATLMEVVARHALRGHVGGALFEAHRSLEVLLAWLVLRGSGGLELRPDDAQLPQRDADGREDDQDDPMSHELVAEPDLRDDDRGVEEG